MHHAAIRSPAQAARCGSGHGAATMPKVGRQHRPGDDARARTGRNRARPTGIGENLRPDLAGKPRDGGGRRAARRGRGGPGVDNTGVRNGRFEVRAGTGPRRVRSGRVPRHRRGARALLLQPRTRRESGRRQPPSGEVNGAKPRPAAGHPTHDEAVAASHESAWSEVPCITPQSGRRRRRPGAGPDTAPRRCRRWADSIAPETTHAQERAATARGRPGSGRICARTSPGNRVTGADVGPHGAGAAARVWTTRAYGMGASKFEPVPGRGACGAAAYRVTVAARERSFSNPVPVGRVGGVSRPPVR